METENVRRNARNLSRVLKALANERRLIVLAYLANEELSVGELECRIGISQSALSQHLARLRRDGLVKTRRSAQNIYYSLDQGPAKAMLDMLEATYGGDSDPVPPRDVTEAA